jgi:glucose-1-phosphate thymidylyltransferase
MVNQSRKGILLAGGAGTRLYPLNQVCSKQLMPIYDKPLIYYSLSTLLLSGIRDILVISTPNELPRFENLLRDGSQWGIHIQYAAQAEPNGIAQAFIIGESFLGNAPCMLVLGDNIFYGDELKNLLTTHAVPRIGAQLMAYRVVDPERYGVVEFDQHRKVLSLEEKPRHPKGNYAVTGLYFYDNAVIDVAKSIKPSARGELEITDVNKKYLEMGQLSVDIMGRGFAWFDTGTHESMLDAAAFIATLQRRQGLMVACPEEIAFRNQWIDADQLLETASKMGSNQYRQYLKTVVELP